MHARARLRRVRPKPLRFPFETPEEREFDAVGFGLNAVDHLVVVPRYPEFDTKTRLIEHERGAGGQTASAMAGLRRLGLADCVRWALRLGRRRPLRLRGAARRGRGLLARRSRRGRAEPDSLHPHRRAHGRAHDNLGQGRAPGLSGRRGAARLRAAWARAAHGRARPSRVRRSGARGARGRNYRLARR